jgi:hypothetical protein
MLIELQFVAAIILIAVTLQIGEIVGSSIEEALGEKPLRERAAEED